MTASACARELARLESQLERYSALTPPSLERWRDVAQRIKRLRKRMLVERRFADFTDQAAALQWNGPEDFLRALHVLWWHQQEREYYNYDAPADLSLCSRDCRRDFEIVCLNSQFQLYGCCLHGSLHECAERRMRDPATGQQLTLAPNCACQIETGQADVVCLFSGRVIDRTISNVRSTARDFQSDSSSERGRAGYSYVMALRGRSDANFRNTDAAHNKASAKAAVAAAQARLDEYYQQYAASDDDDDDGDDVQRRRAPAAAAADGPLRAKRRRLQRPEASASAAAAGAGGGGRRRPKFRPTDYRSERVQKEVLEERRRYLRSVAEDVMNRVLHTPEIRAAINEHQEKKVANRCEDQLYAYHARHSSNEQLPCWIECAAEFWTPFNSYRMLTRVEPDHAERTRFGLLVVQLWEICYRSPYARRQQQLTAVKRRRFCTLAQFALGVLYFMREGMYVGAGARGNMRESLYASRIQFVPFVPRMCVNLPPPHIVADFSASAQASMRTSVEAEPHTSGTREVVRAAPLLRARNKKRKRSLHPNRRVEVACDRTASEASMLPEHWQNKLLGDPQNFQPSDVTRGQAFLRDCLQSFDTEFLEQASARLDDFV